MDGNAFLENEEVQTLKTAIDMSDLIQVYKEIRLLRQPDGNLEKLGSKNAHIIRQELKTIETLYLQLWNKFKENKNYTEVFLGINVHLIFLYAKYDKIDKELIKYIHPLVLKQTELRFKHLKLEEKYEQSSEILKERKKLEIEKYMIINRQVSGESDELYPESIVFSRAKLKILRKIFLESCQKYLQDSKFEKEFLKKSIEYAKILSKVKTLEKKLKEFRKDKPYQKMLRENYVRYSILEEMILNDTGENFV